jgi:hypothetical protein
MSLMRYRQSIRSGLRHFTPLILAATLAVAGTHSADAQQAISASKPVGADSGPLSELSKGIHDDSRPVHERGNTVTHGSVGSMLSRPVHEPNGPSMHSGPLSEISRGAVTENTSDSPAAAVAEAPPTPAPSAPTLLPIGELVRDPARDLDSLRGRLSTLREGASETEDPPITAAEDHPHPGGPADADQH